MKCRGFYNHIVLRVGIRFLFVFCSCLNAQTIVTTDFPEQKSFKSLKQGYLEALGVRKDTVQALEYVNTFLSKAKGLEDTLRMVRGYYYKSTLVSDENRRLAFLDTIIEYARNLKGQNYPTLGYRDKGAIYQRKGNYKAALYHYEAALIHNKGTLQKHIELLLNRDIASLKIRIGRAQEALTSLRNCWHYLKKENYKSRFPELYFDVVYTIANAYRKVAKKDSLRIYTELGLTKENNQFNYYKFLMLHGVLEIQNNNFIKGERQLKEAIQRFKETNDTIALIRGNYFLGKMYVRLDDYYAAERSFRKVDSILGYIPRILPEYTDIYKHLINYYKDTKNKAQLLYYTTKSNNIKDSLLGLNLELTSQYDNTKHLLTKKEIESRQKKTKTLMIVFVVSSLGILTLAIIQYIKRRIYKQRFLSLFYKEQSQSITESKSPKEEMQTIEVPKGIINTTLKKLLEFENGLGYLNPNLNLIDLAHEFGTNRSYLSIIINHYKKERFSSYIKNLRMDYGFYRLKTDSVFRNYTIKAIAQECGFKTGESFSKLFYKKYGLYPSYYIKQLEKST